MFFDESTNNCNKLRVLLVNGVRLQRCIRLEHKTRKFRTNVCIVTPLIMISSNVEEEKLVLGHTVNLNNGLELGGARWYAMRVFPVQFDLY